MRTSTLKIIGLLIVVIHTYDSTVLSTCTGTCVTGCGICNATECSKCQIGYVLSSGNSCSKTTCNIPGCSACSEDGQSCLRCTDPYSIFDSKSSTCTKSCPLSNCAECQAGSSSCKACVSGYSLYSVTNQCIKSVIANCLTMHDFRGKQFVCTLCTSGFKPSSDQTECIPDRCNSIADCESCTNKQGEVCDKCRPGYSFVSGKCQPNTCNVSNCLYCSSSGDCLRCSSKFTLANNTCQKQSCALPNCSSCNPGSAYCEQCFSDYTLNIWNKKCQLKNTNQDSEDSSSNLKYLLFIGIPVAVAIILAIIGYCIYKKGKEQPDQKVKIETEQNLPATNRKMVMNDVVAGVANGGSAQKQIATAATRPPVHEGQVINQPYRP